MSDAFQSGPASPPSFSRKGVFIGRFFKIEFFLDYSWFLIAALVIFELSSEFFPVTLRGYSKSVYYGMGTVAAAFFFLSILLHELGHSLVSQRCGIPVPRITLLFIGGLAEISREPDDARSELKIALGGPAVSVLLVALYGGMSFVLHRAGLSAGSVICQWLAQTNIALVVFNMVPGYPLDGGRVLRALIWGFTGRLRKATFVASRIGIGFAWFLIVAGVYMMAVKRSPSGFILCFIAFFLKSAAESGYTHALQKEVLAGVKVRDFMTADPAWIPSTLPLNLAVDDYFLTNHHVAFPVCAEEQEFRGLLRLEFLKAIPKEKWPYTTAGELVSRDDAESLKIDSEVSAGRAMRLLLAQGTGRLAVTSNGRMVGIVTRHDILHFIRIHTELE